MTTRRVIAVLAAAVYLVLSGCSSDEPPAPKPQPPGPVQTTLTRNYVPVTEGPGGGFTLKLGRGEAHQTREIPDVKIPQPGERYWSLAYFLVLTDTHVTDEQHPARLAFMDTADVFSGLFEDSYRPQEDISPHLLNASVLTANALMRDHGRDLDMVLCLGDLADNASRAEFEWAYQVLEGSGQGVAPWTGSEVRDLGSQEAYDPYVRPGVPSSNAPFPAPGLRRPSGAPLPWYAAVGNHDLLNVGNFPVDDPGGFLNNFLFDGENYVGSLSPFGYIMGLTNLIIDTIDGNPPPQAFYDLMGGPVMGRMLSDPDFMYFLINVATEGEAQIRADVNPEFGFDQLIPPGPVVRPEDIGVQVLPDARREFWGAQGLIDLLRPEHGFAQEPDDPCNGAYPAGDGGAGGYYAMDYVNEQGVRLPLRMIFLYSDEWPLTAMGGMSLAQWEWLQCQLQEAYRQNKLAIVLSHHTSASIIRIGPGVCEGTGPCQRKIVELLQQYPNVILHLAGHTHTNTITPRSHQGDPQRGYWEVVTDSTQVYPQQTRILEVVLYESGAGEVWSTMLDHDDTLSTSSDANTLSCLARTIGVNDPQLPLNHLGYPSPPGTPDDRNRVLLFEVPQEMVLAVSEVLPPSTKIQSRDVFPNGEIQD